MVGDTGLVEHDVLCSLNEPCPNVLMSSSANSGFTPLFIQLAPQPTDVPT